MVVVLTLEDELEKQNVGCSAVDRSLLRQVYLSSQTALS